MSPLPKKIIDRKLLVERKGKFSERVRPVKRHFIPIGARNPYAVYRAITGHNPFPEMSPEAVQEELADKIGYKLKYQQLFDPRWGSCLFCPKTIEAARPKHVVIEANADTVVRLDDKASSSEEQPESTSGASITGAVPQAFTDCAKKLALSTWAVKSLMNAEDPLSLIFPWFRTASGSFPDQKSPAFDEIAQGPIPDCYFLAVLSSLAWFYALYPNANSNGKIVVDSTNQIPFLAPNGQKVSIGGTSSTCPGTSYHVVHTDYSLPLDTRGIPSGAMSEPVTVSWVPFYEKAFVRYLEFIQNITPPSSDDRYPNICRIPCGSPGETLRALTQVSSSSLNYHDTTAVKKANQNPKPTMWNKANVWMTITSTCETGVYLAGKSLKTKYPVVVETYCTGDPKIPPENPTPPPCAAPAYSGVAYKDDLIVASHAYSLLGIHKGKKNGKDYVILRNPYGENPAFNFSSPHDYCLLGEIPDDVQFEFSSIKVGTTSYKRRILEERSFNGVNIKTPKGGVFGLLSEDFVKYFRAIYWVVR